jgi:hypothetical protein
MAKIMTANGFRRKLARKVGWTVVMSTAAYGVETIQREGQVWLLEGFYRLFVSIGRCMSTKNRKNRKKNMKMHPKPCVWGSEDDGRAGKSAKLDEEMV